MADNTGRCDKSTACNDEISDACGPNPSMSCVENLRNQGKAFQCTCTGEPGLPRCPVTTSTSTTTTTTTSTPGAIQCCIRNPTCEPAFNCQILSAGECSTAGGVNVGPGTCAGFPCPTTTTPPSACCTQSTPGGPLDQCSIQGLCQCGLLGGRFLLFQFSCTPNPCVTTTSTISSTTSSTTISSTTTSTTIPACTFLLTWGVPGTGNGELSSPQGVATDGSGNVYIADTGNDRIQKFDASGTFLTTWGSNGSGNGQFLTPRGVATDGSGNVYVADTNNDRIQKFDGSGTFLTTWGSTGFPGNGLFTFPLGVATDGRRNVDVLQTNNPRLQKFDGSG